MYRINIFLSILAVSGCATMDRLGTPPVLDPPQASPEHTAMMTFGLPRGFDGDQAAETAVASLWTGERGSLLGDRRAMTRGDILTVVIEINDSAAITNSTDRSRAGTQEASIGALFGLPEAIDSRLPGGLGVGPGVSLDSTSSFSGDGSVRRNEQLTLRVAATVVEVLPNGVLSIEGSQQVRVNNELRELLVSGFVRPEDVSRQNVITYDNLASARISYGGRGQITDVQQPRIGQEAAELLLPF